MRAHSLVWWTLLSAVAGCAGSQTTIGSSVGEKEATADASSEEPARANAEAGGAGPAPTVGAAAAAAAEEPVEPLEPAPPDPALVKALVDKTGESSPTDNPLHLRLEMSTAPAGELWLLAVVNRGTEPANVRFDLRHLSLSLEPPDDPKRPKWKKKPGPIVCKLPEGFGGAPREQEALSLEPGEGLVQTFDPRLYCISPNGESLLAPGQLATAKLGFAPKPPRVVWKQGKRTEVASLQAAPFVAEPLPAPPAAEAEPVKIDPEQEKRVKQLVSTAQLLSADVVGTEAVEDPDMPLRLRLLRGSDAATERTATATVEVRAKSKKTTLYFRRELLSFTVHGPDGIRGCDPQPDDRAPDRQAYASLGAGLGLSAVSLLSELCPNFTFGRPGLYLVSARLDAERSGAEFGLNAFTGTLQSSRQALVRIRTGDLPALPPPEPVRVRVGQ
jgi:hypothetical protein